MTRAIVVREGAVEAIIDRLQSLVETNCLALIDDGHQLEVSTVVGKENVVFEIYCDAGDEGLIIGAPCRPWTDPHGTRRVAAVLEVEKLLQEGVTRVVLEAYESAMASEEVGHD